MEIILSFSGRTLPTWESIRCWPIGSRWHRDLWRRFYAAWRPGPGPRWSATTVVVAVVTVAAVTATTVAVKRSTPWSDGNCNWFWWSDIRVPAIRSERFVSSTCKRQKAIKQMSRGLWRHNVRWQRHTKIRNTR